METPWFYTHDLSGNGLLALDDASAKHAQVLRLREGDGIVLTNGLGIKAQATIKSLGKKQCLVEVNELKTIEHQVNRRCAIAISPLKNTSRLEWFLEKATELGIAEIFPMVCHRTVREHFRHDRLQAIVISAMLQSQQAWLPVLHTPGSFDAFLQSSQAAAYHHRWVAHCADMEKHHLAAALKPGMTDSLLLIGPEGDFTADEIVKAEAAQFNPVSLGETRLRTETAGVVGATLLCLL